jgi:predicted aldo/keto reductase-like oxidoreductase
VLNDYPFEGVLLGYSAMNFAFRERALEAAAESNRGVAVMNPLAGGMIPKHPEHFQFLKTRKNETVVEAALRFLFNDERITVALVGFSKQEHLDEALRAVERYTPLPDSEVDRIRNELGRELNTLCTGCGYCDECPSGLDIPRLMQSYNQLLMSKDTKALIGTMRDCYGVYPDHGIDKCLECRLCEEACTQKLPIVERLQHIKRVADKAMKAEGA